MTLKNYKDKLVAEIVRKVRPYVLEMVEQQLTSIHNMIDDVEHERNELSDHVDDLENEFRHEVHEVQHNVEYNNMDTDGVNQLIYEYLNDVGLTQDVIDALNSSDQNEALESLIDEINDVGNQLERVATTLKYVGQLIKVGQKCPIFISSLKKLI